MLISCEYVNTQENAANTPEEICEIIVFSDFYTTTPPNFNKWSDGPEAQDRVGPGGGGGGLRLLVHLRGGGREYYRPRHLLRGQHHGPGWPPRHQHHGGAPQHCGGYGGEGGDLHHQCHHLHSFYTGPHYCHSLYRLHHREEGGGAPGQGAQHSGGNGVYNLSFLIMLLILYDR